MKEFIKICRMSQKVVKAYACSELRQNGYEPIAEDGFLYAKGTYPVLLVAHMDTVHKELVKTVKTGEDGKISSPQGIGGDDRCGIYMILEIIKKYHCSVLFTEDEEVGGVGAEKFCKTDYIYDLGVNYMIELDRANKDDAVFYSNGNKEFIDWICCEEVGFVEDIGSYSDISDLMPASGIAGVNISSAYYRAHTKNEYVMFYQLEENINRVIKLISREVEQPFEYKRAEFKYNYNSYGYGDFYWNSKDYNNYEYEEVDPAEYLGYGNYIDIENDIDNGYIADDQCMIIQFIYYDAKGTKCLGSGIGMTEASCLGDFLTKHPYICVADISETIQIQ